MQKRSLDASRNCDGDLINKLAAAAEGCLALIDPFELWKPNEIESTICTCSLYLVMLAKLFKSNCE